jgi:MobA-like NTP transferase domain
MEGSMTRQAHELRPLIILAGGARDDEAVRGETDRIAGPKGVTIQVGGRPLIDVVVERYAACGSFEPILVAGPMERYGPTRGPATVVDTDVDFAGNIRAGIAAIPPEVAPGPVFFSSCDVIPEPAELERVMDDYYAHVPLDFWYPQIRVAGGAESLGTSAYKRKYWIRPEGEAEAAETLPGHLLAIDPEVVRRPLFYRCFELAYQSRTQPVAWRFLSISGGTLLQLVREDLRSLRAGRLPFHLVEILGNGFRLAWGLARGGITQAEVERYLGKTFSTRRHRRRYPDRGGRIPILDALSLARDIDTQGEAEEFHLEVRS